MTTALMILMLAIYAVTTTFVEKVFSRKRTFLI